MANNPWEFKESKAYIDGVHVGTVKDVKIEPKAAFHFRGGRLFWKLFFWWDYRIKLSYPFVRLRFWRYAHEFNTNNNKVYRKDRLKPWKKEEHIGECYGSFASFK